ncbi:hypothetical protein D3C72_1560150 [compost metagenome]
MPMALSLKAARAQGPGSTQALVRMQRVAQRYDMQGSGRGATPMMLDLHACRDVQGLNRLLRGRSSRNLSKIRRAERIGYRVRPILLIPPAIATGHLRPQSVWWHIPSSRAAVNWSTTWT